MLTVNWDENVCQHAAVCVNTLPQVFKVVDGEFVVDTQAATEQQIRDVCDKCPSGALTAAEG